MAPASADGLRRRRRRFECDAALEALEAAGDLSLSQVVADLPAMEPSLLFHACRYLAAVEWKAAAPVLLRRFETCGDRGVRSALGQALEVRSTRAARGLARLSRTHSDPLARLDATYFLSFSGTREPWTTEVLLEILEDPREYHEIRAQAEEGLAYRWRWGDARTRGFRRVAEALLKATHDMAPDVRFWAVFALGQMRCQRALPRLLAMAAEDHEHAPGWWTVAEEASDALRELQHRESPTREAKRDSAPWSWEAS